MSPAGCLHWETVICRLCQYNALDYVSVVMYLAFIIAVSVAYCTNSNPGKCTYIVLLFLESKTGEFNEVNLLL